MDLAFSNKNIAIISDYLKKGSIVVLPTDTIYGIVGQALVKKTVEIIYQLRKRSPEKPCIILISQFSDLKKLGITVTAQQLKVLKHIWPNAVSVVLPCMKKSLSYLHRGTKTLAIRMPKNKKLQQIIKKSGPLIAPSANIEGCKPAVTSDEAKQYFGNNAGILYVSGQANQGQASTLVKLENVGFTILRQGKVKIKAGLLKH